MREQVIFNRVIKYLYLNRLEELLCCCKSKYGKEHLRHVKFGLEKLIVDSVAANMRIHYPGVLHIYLLFVDSQQVERNIIRVRLNCIREEFNLKRN